MLSWFFHILTLFQESEICTLTSSGPVIYGDFEILKMEAVRY